MKELPDDHLINLSKNGNRKAFSELVLRYQDRVYWVARKYLSGHDEALDISQDVFVRAYRGISKFRGDSQFFTWLFKITKNLCINEVRKKKLRSLFAIGDRDDFIETDDPQPDHVLIHSEIRTKIEEAISLLPSKQKEVFLLRYYEEMPYEEMSTMLKKTTGGLKANYFHAVRKIQEYLNNEM